MKPLENRTSQSPVQISWQQILGSLEDGVVTIDQNGKIVFFNEAAEVMTETSAAQALQGHLERIFRQESWLIELVNKSRPPRQESARGEGDLLTRRGRKLPVSITVSPLPDHQGNFIGSILLLRDIKRRRELEEDLKRADRLATMGTLAAGLAHEIRNPLGGIRGAAQLLRRGLDPNSSLCEYTDIMVREVDRLNKLIEQLLDLSRPLQLTLEPVNIHEILDDVLLLQSQAGETAAIVRKVFDPSLPPIRGDRAQLTQVFLNLVKNALEAMNGGGSLTVVTRLETDYYVRDHGTGRNRFIRVEISDEGKGIKEEDMAQIFSPFFSTKNTGTGLGLAICYNIIKEHSGTIRVETTEGKGTTFKVSLLVAE